MNRTETAELVEKTMSENLTKECSFTAPEVFLSSWMEHAEVSEVELAKFLGVETFDVEQMLKGEVDFRDYSFALEEATGVKALRWHSVAEAFYAENNLFNYLEDSGEWVGEDWYEYPEDADELNY